MLNLEGYGTLNTGDHFTQQQVDNGLVRYFDYGFAAVQDAFRFAVTDGNGGLASGVFQINAIVPTVTPAAGFDFKMSPNPTSNLVRLDFGTGFTSDATIQLLDATGRQMRSVNINSGTPTLLLDVHGLPAGIYAVTVRQGQGVATRKLIVR